MSAPYAAMKQRRSFAGRVFYAVKAVALIAAGWFIAGAVFGWL